MAGEAEGGAVAMFETGYRVPPGWIALPVHDREPGIAVFAGEDGKAVGLMTYPLKPGEAAALDAAIALAKTKAADHAG